MLAAKSPDAGHPMIETGQKLRQLRSSLGLSLRDVEAMSYRIATGHQEPAFAIPFSRLFEIESRGMLPTIYRLYSLSAIYGTEYADLLLMFGIDLGHLVADLKFASVPLTHKVNAGMADHVLMSIQHSSPGTEPMGRRSAASDLSTMFFAGGCKDNISWVHVGTKDFTMYPIIAPASLLQVDGTVRKVRSAGWRSEHDRPIYLFDTRQDGYRVGWCSLFNSQLTIQPHPMSPTPSKAYRYPVEAEVIGQVVAVSTRLTVSTEPEARARM